MSGAMSLLFRIVVQRYYLLNSGFFLVAFLLLFGIIDPAASIRLHADIIRLMPFLPVVLAGVLGMLALYFLKCLRFALLQSGQPANAMLFELQALPRPKLRRYLAGCFAAIYMPAIVYSCCVIVISARQGAWGTIAATVLSQACLMLVATASLERRLLDRLRATRADRLMQKLAALRPDYISFGRYFAAYLLSEKKAMLLLLKGSSLLLLQLMVYINREEPEKAGTAYLLLFLIVAHGLVPWQLRQFSDRLPWLRNLPISRLRRFGAFAGTYALLFLPELIFLLLHVRSTLSFAEMLSFYALSVAMLSGFHAVQYLPGLGMERYVLLLFLLYPLSIIALAVISPWLLAAFWLLTAMLVFTLRCYRSEAGIGE